MLFFRYFYSKIFVAGNCLLFLLAPVLGIYPVMAQNGTLELSVMDASTNALTPARVEVKGSDGNFYVAEDALLVGGDCDMSDEGAGLTDMETTLAHFSREIFNPYTKSKQFYTNGNATVELPAGKTMIRVFKGPEYDFYYDSLNIEGGETNQHTVILSRWINMTSRGWYSADDHLHIPRPVKTLNPYISKMMQAEDIRVANLLQMGKVLNFEIAPQHDHGPESYYRENGYILAAGQENPRTHFLGHTITLGADKTINYPEKYLIYRLVWEEAMKQGGINGFAHGYFPAGSFVSPQNGLAVILPHDLMHFIEVLQFNRADYQNWYDILNLGFRVTPTAGTDFPCAGQSIPGHERFYTRVEGAFNYKNWIEAVKNGKTFVTTGPIPEFRINGKEIGGEINLDQESSVEIEGSIRFNTQWNRLNLVEIIQNGEVIHRITPRNNEGKIEFAFHHKVYESSWFALRGYGNTMIERLSVNPWQFQTFKPTSNVHTAPVYVTVANTPALHKTPRSKSIAKAWLARLEDMENVLAEENISYLAEELANSNSHAVPRRIFYNNREDLLQEIQDAKEFFNEIIK